MPEKKTVVCSQALRDMEDARRNVHRWENLQYAFGAAVTVLSIVLVLALIWGAKPQAAITGMGALATGGGMAFVSRKRKDAKADFDKAKTSLRGACGKQRLGVNQEQDPAPADVVLPDAIVTELEAYTA